jgi:hypothetical protein
MLKTLTTTVGMVLLASSFALAGQDAGRQPTPRRGTAHARALARSHRGHATAHTRHRAVKKHHTNHRRQGRLHTPGR